MRFARVTLAGGTMAVLIITLGAAVRSVTPPDPSWLTWNPATRTVNFQLIAGLTGSAKSPFNFNGYVDGELTLVVPDSATLVVKFENRDGTPHSAMVIDDKDPMPTMAPETPAMPRAYTVKASEGLGYYQKDVIRFRATPPGGYRIFCGVPGHGLSGMWIRLKVDPTVEAPKMVETIHDPRAK